MCHVVSVYRTWTFLETYSITVKLCLSAVHLLKRNLSERELLLREIMGSEEIGELSSSNKWNFTVDVN